MEALGPNPEAMLKSVIAERARLLREKSVGKDLTPAEDKALKDLQKAEGLKGGKVTAWFADLTGEANWPANPSAARFWAIARATQTLSKLGGAALSAVADVYVKAMNMRHVSGMNWGEAVTRSLGQYLKLYGGEERRLARQLGAFVDDMAGELRARWDVHESLPGFVASMQDKLFRWSGLNWIMESGKAGYALWFSRHLGEAADKAWGQLDASYAALLERHGFDAGRWDMLRLMTEEGPDGQRLIVPARAEGIPDAALRAFLAEDLKKLGKTFAKDAAARVRAEAALFEATRTDLRARAMGMIADETRYAIIEPDARAQAFMRQGTRPGTALGEILRSVMQFKSFPISYMQRQIGGRRWVRGERQQGMRRGWNFGSLKDAALYDPNGAVGAAVTAFAFGYISMTLKDLARGKTPRDPSRKETVYAALLQSGGAGILGDFLFNKVNRFGGGLKGTLAGPLVGEAGRAVTAVQSMLRGEFQDGGEDALRIVMDNAPFVNLWYTREAANWGILYHLREMISPGTLSRTERKLKEEYGQENLLFSPARSIKRGGWSNGIFSDYR
jgi:hypothetical protein